MEPRQDDEPTVMLLMEPAWCLHLAYQRTVEAPDYWLVKWIRGAFTPEAKMYALTMDELLTMYDMLLITDPRSTQMPNGKPAIELLLWVWLGMLELTQQKALYEDE